MSREAPLMNKTGIKASLPTPFTADATTAVVRYHVQDVERSIAFYTRHLGFHATQRSGPVFATVSRGNLHLLLSGPGSSGSRPMPDGRAQTSGGWNRIVLYVDDLDAILATLANDSTRFRNEVESGPGGRQIQIEDPDGNPIELHEAPREQGV
jgi:glyoxylase I family protein